MQRTDRLTTDEANQARGLVDEHGGKRAAELLGLCDERTLYKAIARVDIHTLTASVVRSRLAEVGQTVTLCSHG